KLPQPAGIPDGFSAESYAASGAMEFGGGEPIELEALVSVELATLLKESPLNATQQLLSDDTGFRLKVAINDSWQLQWWILSQGAQINVIAPGMLRSRVQSVLRDTLIQYQEKGVEIC
ncbi:MAG: WYL domain-containing protein, partial [Polynucleobacter sp.]|nr:WYL domain-containing protein [Polynucleobacter sp.]